MTQSGDPLEDAVAERINSTIKEEFTDDETLSTYSSMTLPTRPHAIFSTL